MSKLFRTTMIILAVLFCVLGLALILFPADARLVICYAVGAASAIYGIIRIVIYFMRKDAPGKFQFGAAIGLAALLVGAILIFRAVALAESFAVLAGAAIVVDSIVKLQLVLDIRRLGGSNYLAPGISALVMFAFGVVLLFNPFTDAVLSVVCGGIALLLTGLTGLWIMIKSTSLLKQLNQSA